MLKTGNEFLDNFARLGVFSKVQALMDDESESECSVIKSPMDSEVPTQPSTSAAASDEPATKGMRHMFKYAEKNQTYFFKKILEN